MGGVARARALSVPEKRELARSAATARWAARRSIVTVRGAPEAVRRLLKSYDPATLRWAKADHRYAVVREILVRGDEEANRWLRGVLSRDQVRELVRKYAGAGCNEPERERLRKELRLGPEAIPVRPYLGLKWRHVA